MKKVMIAIVMLASAGAASAADFGSLAAGAAELKAAAEKNTPAVIAEAADKADGGRLSALGGATVYEKLANLFKEGVPATKEDLYGWHSGRQINILNEDVFLGALLVGKHVSPPDGGPLFEKETGFKVMYLTRYEPDYYDELKSLDAFNMMSGLGDGIMLAFPEAKGTDKTTSSLFTIEIRKARGYLVERFTISDKRGGDKPTILYSYYFKDVTPALPFWR